MYFVLSYIYFLLGITTLRFECFSFSLNSINLGQLKNLKLHRNAQKKLLRETCMCTHTHPPTLTHKHKRMLTETVLAALSLLLRRCHMQWKQTEHTRGIHKMCLCLNYILTSQTHTCRARTEEPICCPQLLPAGTHAVYKF